MTLRRSLLAFAVATALAGSLCAASSQARPLRPARGDGYVARLEQALAVQSLNARLLSADSATRVLEAWCAEHRLAPEAVITAEPDPAASKPISAAQRLRLKIGPDEPVRYRRVKLRCGAVVLSEADNWYVPARLTPQMNEQLERTDTPFGKVVAPLGINRRTVGAEVLWRPLGPADWDMRSRADNIAAFAAPADPPPAHVIEHRALVFDRDGAPLAEVVETYTGAGFSFLKP
jgi:chorismate-pyruvate lyase